MEYSRSELMPGVFLSHLRSDKFKTACMSVNLLTQLKRETAAMNALLPSVLRRGTQRYPDMEKLSARLDELYGAAIEPVIRRIGEVHCLGFFASFPAPAFLPALDPSSNLWTHLSTPGDARISYVAYARDPALGGLPAPDSDGALRLPAIDLYHEFGSTTLARIPDEKTGGFVPAPDDLAFAPGPHPPCTAVEGPWLPLALPAGRYRATILEEKPDIAAAILSDPLGSPSPSPAAPSPFRLAGADGVDGLSVAADGATADFAYDGTSPVSFRVSYDASRPGVLSAIAVAPVGK